VSSPRRLACGLSFFLGGCGSVTALPPLPTEDAQAGLLVQAGDEPTVFAFSLGPGQPAPVRAPFEAPSVPPLAWLTFSCPLSTLSLVPGRQSMNENAAELLRLPTPTRTHVLADGDWAEASLGTDLERVLRRLPLGEENFCPGSARGVEIEDRLLTGGEREDEIAFARIMPFEDEALFLRAVEEEQERSFERLVDGATVAFTETVRRVVAGRIHQLGLFDPEMEGALRLDADELPYLEGSADAGGVTLWGRGMRARFASGLDTPSLEAVPELTDVEAIRAVSWSDAGGEEISVLVVDDQPEVVSAVDEDDDRLRNLRLFGSEDGGLEELLHVELPIASAREPELLRLADGAVMVRGLSSRPNEAHFVRRRNGAFELTRLPVPAGRLLTVEGQDFILTENEQAFVYEGGLFVELSAQPLWPFLSKVQRQATIDGRALFNAKAQIAERIDAATVCPVAELGRERWAAVAPWGKAWAFLERRDGREAGLFLVRPSSAAPACARPSEAED